MTFDNRFIGMWKTDAGAKSQIALDPQSGDGFWYYVGNKVLYSLPDVDTLFYGSVGGQPFRWKRSVPGSGTTIISHWRHDAEPTWPNDSGEDIIFREDGTYVNYFDGESTYYNGTFELSQDASGLYISTTEYRQRLQTNADTFTLTMVDGNVRTGTFAFGVDPNTGKDTVTMAFSNPPGDVSTMQRI